MATARRARTQHLCGMISGLKLSAGLDDLARLYLATIQAVAYGTRHIIESLNAKGYRISTLFACGGGTKNPVFLREHADATGCTLVLPQEPEAVLLGAAILGAVAAKAFPSILEAMGAMSGIGRVIEPGRGAVARYHDAKYSVFKKLYEDQMSYRRLMAGQPQPRPSSGRSYQVLCSRRETDGVKNPVPAARPRFWIGYRLNGLPGGNGLALAAESRYQDLSLCARFVHR